MTQLAIQSSSLPLSVPDGSVDSEQKTDHWVLDEAFLITLQPRKAYFISCDGQPHWESIFKSSVLNDTRCVLWHVSANNSFEELKKTCLQAYAEMALKIWPYWYQRSPFSIHSGNSIEKHRSQRWLELVSKKCRAGALPITRKVSLTVNAQQLSLALSGVKLIHIWSVPPEVESQIMLQALSMLAEWWSQTTQSTVCVSADTRWQKQDAIDHISYHTRALSDVLTQRSEQLNLNYRHIANLNPWQPQNSLFQHSHSLSQPQSASSNTSGFRGQGEAERVSHSDVQEAPSKWVKSAFHETTPRTEPRAEPPTESQEKEEIIRDGEPCAARPMRITRFLGMPHPSSPGEQFLHEALECDVETRGLFLPNVPVKTRFDSVFVVDFLWPEHGAVIEIDGYRFHSSRTRFRLDRERDFELTLSGFYVIRFCHDAVVLDMSDVVKKIKLFMTYVKTRV